MGLGVVPFLSIRENFRDLMGTVNKEIAAVADEVHFLLLELNKELNKK